MQKSNLPLTGFREWLTTRERTAGGTAGLYASHVRSILRRCRYDPERHEETWSLITTAALDDAVSGYTTPAVYMTAWAHYRRYVAWLQDAETASTAVQIPDFTARISKKGGESTEGPASRNPEMSNFLAGAPVDAIASAMVIIGLSLIEGRRDHHGRRTEAGTDFQGAREWRLANWEDIGCSQGSIVLCYKDSEISEETLACWHVLARWAAQEGRSWPYVDQPIVPTTRGGYRRLDRETADFMWARGCTIFRTARKRMNLVMASAQSGSLIEVQVGYSKNGRGNVNYYSSWEVARQMRLIGSIGSRKNYTDAAEHQEYEADAREEQAILEEGMAFYRIGGSANDEERCIRDALNDNLKTDWRVRAIFTLPRLGTIPTDTKIKILRSLIASQTLLASTAALRVVELQGQEYAPAVDLDPTSLPERVRTRLDEVRGSLDRPASSLPFAQTPDDAFQVEKRRPEGTLRTAWGGLETD